MLMLLLLGAHMSFPVENWWLVVEIEVLHVEIRDCKSVLVSVKDQGW
jgi:hypothetical protein